MRDLGRDALEYAGMGWAVFPCHSPSPTGCDCGKTCVSPAKHPRTQHGFHDATTDVEQISKWWGMWPAANIGLATGKASGVVVADIDPRHGGLDAWNALTATHGQVPEGPVAQTGSGGYHFFFAYPEGQSVASRSGSVGEGIDQRGDGGYAILPPSVHVTGAPYQWCEGCAPWEVVLPEIPPWLLSLLVRRPSGGGGGGQRFDERIPAGQRRSALLSLAGTLRNKGASREVIQATLLAMNEEQCDPPLDLTEVSALAADAARRWDPQIEVPVVVPQRKVVAGPYLPQPFSARELEGTELADVKWVVPEVLPEGLAVLAGKPKLGKSWMALGVGIGVSEGGLVFGEYPVEDGDVLVLALEDNKRRLKSRLKLMMAGEPFPERLWMETKWPREDEGGVAALDVWLGQHPKGRLVVIDTLARFRVKDDGKNSKSNAYGADYASIEGLQELAGRHGVCVMVITHYRKAISEDWVDSVTGTLGIAGAADTVWGLSRPRAKAEAGPEPPVLRITGRDVVEVDIAMAFEGSLGRWTAVGEAEDFQAGVETREMIRVLGQIGHPAKTAEVAPLLGKTRAATVKLMYRASVEGHIVSYGNGLYGAKKMGDDSINVLMSSEAKNEDKRTSRTEDIEDIQRSVQSYKPSNEGSDLTFDTLSEAAKMRTLDEDIRRTSDVLMSRFVLRKGLEPPNRPLVPCPACGEENWWPKATGGWLCLTCRPWSTPVEEERELHDF